MNLLKFLGISVVLLIPTLFIGGQFAWGIYLLIFLILTMGLIFGNRFTKSIVLMIWHDREDYDSGEKVQFKLVLSNTGLGFLPWIQMDMAIPEKLAGKTESGKVLFLGPLGSGTSVYDFTANYKGKYHFQNVKIRYSDLLGLFHWSKKFDESFTISVRPKVKPIVGFSIHARQPLGKYVSKNAAFEDLSNIKDIRKYHVGDSFKKIHWKITAHRGELFIREPEATGSSELVLVLDLFHGAYSDVLQERYLQEEQCAECAAAVVNQAFRAGLPVKIQYFTDRLYTVKLEVEKGLESFLDILAEIEADGVMPVSEMIRNELGRHGNRSEILIVTNNISKSLMSDINVKGGLHHITVLSQALSSKEDLAAGLIENGVRLRAFKTSEKNVWIGEVKGENV